MIELPALNRLYDLEEVSAALVFRNDGRVVGFAAPTNYTEATINQIAMALCQPMKQVEIARIGLKDLRVTYEGYSIWIKRFGGGNNLAVFLQHGAHFNLLRQPINLAVLNLEKTIVREKRSGKDTQQTAALLAKAREAEMEMLTVEGYEANAAFDQLSLLAEFFFGPVGTQMLHNGIHEGKIPLPISSRHDMDQLVQFAAKLLPNVEHKKMFLDEAGDLMDRMELGLQEAAATPAPDAASTNAKG
ncbi:MAG: hypothetical protein PHD76_14350 [Methylacidiphilales bacterium]|nr:hypothetical protein [Candidatus Methylacidiphilales bacterium]